MPKQKEKNERKLKESKPLNKIKQKFDGSMKERIKDKAIHVVEQVFEN